MLGDGHVVVEAKGTPRDLKVGGMQQPARLVQLIEGEGLVLALGGVGEGDQPGRQQLRLNESEWTS